MRHNGLIRLDRMLIEEAGPDPSRQAHALLEQLPQFAGPIPVHKIAAALDIVAIWKERTHSMEAALVTDPERSKGVILVNAKSSRRRRRYSIAHELGHFLNERHQPIHPGTRFTCTSHDLAEAPPADQAALSWHARQEAEANRFAIELLAPEYAVRRFIADPPNLAAVDAIADQREISREASARRYVELSPHPIAIVFSKDGITRYGMRGPCFRFPLPNPGTVLDLGPWQSGNTGLTRRSVVDARAWFTRPPCSDLTVQTLWQRGGYAMTLLDLRL